MASMGKTCRVQVFAYGSNMDPHQMLRRCPSARMVGPAYLPDYRLAFVGESLARRGAVATVERAPGDWTLGLVWSVALWDLPRLDAFEGVPRVYDRRLLYLERWDSRRRMRAEVYVHAPARRNLPGIEYLRQIAGAYLDVGFDLEPLGQAVLRQGDFTEEQAEGFLAWLRSPRVRKVQKESEDAASEHGADRANARARLRHAA